MPQTTIWKNNKYKLFSRFYYKGIIIYWLLLLLFIATIISLPIIKVDVSTQSRGIINTVNKLSPISTGVTARVTNLNIFENKTVSSGDTLIILEQTGINSEITIAKDQIQLFETYLSDLEKLVKFEGSNINTPLYQQEQADFINGITKLKRSIRKKQLDYERTRQLFYEDVLPISTLQEDSFQLKSAEDELLVFKTNTMAKWELDKKNYALNIQDLQIKIENLLQQKNQYFITAPFDGNIISFNGIAEGSIVNENDIICMLSPEDILLAECYISSSDIGLISNGMKVRIQVDSYNYNQWGLMDGTVVSIAHDVTEKNGQFVYVVKSKMHSDHLVLSNGLKGYLKKGMSITGRFIVTQRSLFQLLFDNVNDWLNPRIIHPKDNNEY
ncbi:HlyD family secretion protein [Carboxylicivirga caseinilyticus]|uniref:HlyD family secretion protein n=1 Tax=Carboxylicivirga caseinilyticus TaxID=3417572 RepID=UPI003D358F61|nr:HlyD family efflux transporter periplasmic adaptor subunit [Marinilabiliaceae bacterium A049]